MSIYTLIDGTSYRCRPKGLEENDFEPVKVKMSW